jgi:hypothetical protein
MFTPSDTCLPLQTHVYPFRHMLTPSDTCLPLQTHAYPCRHMLTPSDTCLPHHARSHIQAFATFSNSFPTAYAAGNTAAPIFLRGIVRVMHSLAHLIPGLDKEGLEFARSNPRVISYYLFDKHQTRMLLLITVLINVTEYVFFLSSTMSRTEAQVTLPGSMETHICT